MRPLWLLPAGHLHNFEKNLLRCDYSPDGSQVTCGSADRMVSVGWTGPLVAYRSLSLLTCHARARAALPNPSSPSLGHPPAPTPPHLQVNVWDTATRKLLYKLPGHTGSVNEVVYHPKVGAGRRAAVGVSCFAVARMSPAVHVRIAAWLLGCVLSASCRPSCAGAHHRLCVQRQDGLPRGVGAVGTRGARVR